MPNAAVQIGNKIVGDGQRVFVVAEIGINHNGSLETAKKLIDGAVLAGCDAVKFQKRTPEFCVPPYQRGIPRHTPWGLITYIEYRQRLEFDFDAYMAIDKYCRERNILWFASCWDEQAVSFMECFEPPCYKSASASVTDLPLLHAMKSTGRPMIVSTGMSTALEIERAVETIGTEDLLIAHSTSTYPCPLDELNLRMIHTLKALYPQCPIGYSGHEVGLAPTWAAVSMGATFIERHISLDRSMWGTDQAASLEVVDFVRLVSLVREIERSMGDGIKRVHESELPALRKLRRVRPNGDAPLGSSSN